MQLGSSKGCDSLPAHAALAGGPAPAALVVEASGGRGSHIPGEDRTWHAADGTRRGKAAGSARAATRAGARRWLFNRHDVTDTDIDKALKAGKNPRRAFGGKISKMSPEDARKVGARIKAREDKRK